MLLLFIELKMIFESLLEKIGSRTHHSLIIILGILSISILSSILIPEKNEGNHWSYLDSISSDRMVEIFSENKKLFSEYSFLFSEDSKLTCDKGFYSIRETPFSFFSTQDETIDELTLESSALLSFSKKVGLLIKNIICLMEVSGLLISSISFWISETRVSIDIISRPELGSSITNILSLDRSSVFLLPLAKDKK